VSNLIDGVWLYGSIEVIVVQSVVRGCNGHMLVYGELFGEYKIYLLIVYVWGLSNNTVKNAVADSSII
jgi:hypothetical protein